VAVGASCCSSMSDVAGRVSAAADAASGFCIVRAARCGQACACRMSMHVHTYHHLLTLTNSTATGRTLRQPRAYTSTDVC
jgi:hypothetical protein